MTSSPRRCRQLSTAQARRIALAAQGFNDPPHATPTLRTFDRTLARTGVLQVDSVNVLARAHLMPLYSRMGPYDTALLDRANTQTAARPRRVVEYWAHVQAFMPVELWPLMRHRMEHYRAQQGKWWSVAEARAGWEQEVLAAVAERGPVTARQLDADFGAGERSKEHWGWNWSESRKMLDHLFASGQVAVAGRNSAFEVRYDLPERVLPAEVLAAPVPSPHDAAVALVRRAAIAHGVATGACLSDYYRMGWRTGAGIGPARPAVEQLVEAGELLPVEVEGWSRPAYLHRDAPLPRRVRARTLLSPFDPVVWQRERTERLFDFTYRIEIYTPAAQRVHGYYVLPFLLGDRLVGRVDLKADRRTGRLLVLGAFAEPGVRVDEVAVELRAELDRLAGWLGLTEVSVAANGDLAPALSRL
ncbi:winged helix-turn-helix domain-containing protein [Nocardioides daejeonensis]|uniref:winged helix-turn-helix domain-containing protein n=1 Tax=Nocardioides daejeonensis TaxID=1046556 RepID=UPI000D7503DA|nr:crosslink repair DNA glycosylase YcaQ family protein [Nocardioides daejeonensis]